MKLVLRQKSRARRSAERIETDAAFSEKVCAELKARGWSATKLAKELSIDVGFMSRILSNKRGWGAHGAPAAKLLGLEYVGWLDPVEEVPEEVAAADAQEAERLVEAQVAEWQERAKERGLDTSPRRAAVPGEINGRRGRTVLPLPDESERGFIYFVRCERTDLVKIGTTESLVRRLAQLRAQCPTKLELVLLVRGGRALERALHEQLDDRRSHGEWFRVSLTLLRQVRTALRSLEVPFDRAESGP